MLFVFCGLSPEIPLLKIQRHIHQTDHHRNLDQRTDDGGSEPLFVGKTEGFLVVCLGAWTFHFAIQKEGRFPQIEHVIPSSNTVSTTLELNPADRNFLAANLPKLPTREGGAITVDLNGSIAIRSRDEDSATPTELVLTNSSRDGDEVCLSTNRRFLQRAVEMGFERLSIYGAEPPVCCRDDSRSYVWALLGKDGVIKANPAAVRIESPVSSPFPPVSRRKRRRQFIPSTSKSPMTQDHSTSTTAPPSQTASASEGRKHAKSNSSADAIELAIQLRSELRQLLGRSNELIRSLKSEKRNHRLLKTTLASLKQLQQVA